MIYERIKLLAVEKGISIYRIERDCGLSNGSIRKWGKDSNQMPRADLLTRVAQYLNTTVEYLMEGDESNVI